MIQKRCKLSCKKIVKNQWVIRRIIWVIARDKSVPKKGYMRAFFSFARLLVWVVV